MTASGSPAVRITGGNSLAANLFAAVAGAFMYFATLTEVPILQGLLGSGMGRGPALAVDGQILVSGHVPSTPRLKELLGALGARPA